jgi:hypothetical protein
MKSICARNNGRSQILHTCTGGSACKGHCQAKNDYVFTPAIEAHLRNVSALAHGTGARYLECIRGEGNDLVAKAWHRRMPVNAQVVIRF